MTTNLAAIAGPSRYTSVPKIEPVSPLNSISTTPVNGDPDGPAPPVPAGGVSKPGLSVGENGEVVKVPAFLNKLYSMVSDTDTDNLIYWAESGDSFFVPNHERFGKELLPRFFKHANFSSFVRQLNMYGFHKVPHLQSGVLKNEAPSELWEFVNPFFKRDQPQLLSRVTRKNNRPAAASAPTPTQGSTGTRSSARQAAANALSSNGIHLLTDGTIEGEAGPLVGPAGQLADLHAIQNGINAIRQTQAAIGADLKALQASNEHLWREALETRDRQQKHEETIDLIVTFLERLFGTEGEGLKGLKEAMRRGGMGTRGREDSASDDTSIKKRRRLMIEAADAVAKEDETGRFVEVQEPSATIEPFSTVSSARSSESWSTGQRFQSLPTDDEASPKSQPRTTSLKHGGEQTLHQAAISPMSDAPELPSLRTAKSFRGHQQQQPNGGAANGDANGAAANGSDASGLNLDSNLLQTTIGSLLQSPAAAQMFLNSLNSSSQGQALATPKGVKPSPTIGGETQDPTMALFSPLPNHDGIVQSQNDLMGAYHKAVGVNQDVGKLQESIDSLVRSMGLDLPDQGQNPHEPMPVSCNPDTSFNDSDFNVDELLDQLTANNDHNLVPSGPDAA